MLSVDAISFEDRFCASKKGGVGRGGGGFQHRVLCTWQLPWLAVEQPWLALAATIGGRNLSTCWGTNSGTLLLTENCLHVNSFLSEGAFTGQRALTIESSLMSGCG